jgi:hypothetical protein
MIIKLIKTGCPYMTSLEPFGCADKPAENTVG